MAETKQITVGELIERLSHARRRMSTRKGDRETIALAIDVMAQMAQRLAAAEVREMEAVIEPEPPSVVLTDA